MSDLVTQVANRAARLQRLLAEVWELEAELNALHRAMGVPYGELLTTPPPHHTPSTATAPPPVGFRPARMVIPAQRIKNALLRGPLQLRGEKHSTAILVERCEDIPGADLKAVRAVLREMVRAGSIQRDRDKYWRAA